MQMAEVILRTTMIIQQSHLRYLANTRIKDEQAVAVPLTVFDGSGKDWPSDLLATGQSLYPLIHHADDPLSFPRCGGLITQGFFVYWQFSVPSDPACHLRWNQTGGDRGERFGVGGRHWPCAIMRGANTHRWQSLDHVLAVAIPLALLSWIRCVQLLIIEDVEQLLHQSIAGQGLVADNAGEVTLAL